MSATGERFVAAMIQAMGFEPNLLAVPGVSIAPSVDRAGSALAAAYAIGEHVVLWCDPAIVVHLEPLVASMAPDLADWARRAEAAGAGLVGAAEMTTLGGGGLVAVAAPDGYAMRPLDRDCDEDLAMAARFVDAIGPVAADDAEIELDDLDPLIRVLVDGDGAVAAFAGARAWASAPGFHDIGVAVRPDVRTGGLGRAVVGELCAVLLAGGHQPLYRYNADNEASRRLAAGLGFVKALELTGYRFVS